MKRKFLVRKTVTYLDSALFSPGAPMKPLEYLVLKMLVVRGASELVKEKILYIGPFPDLGAARNYLRIIALSLRVGQRQHQCFLSTNEKLLPVSLRMGEPRECAIKLFEPKWYTGGTSFLITPEDVIVWPYSSLVRRSIYLRLFRRLAKECMLEIKDKPPRSR